MEKIGQFEIREELGRGGFGVVYKAYDTFMERMVAIKTMSDELSADPSYRKKFVGEAQKAFDLHHDNIVRVYHLSQQEGRPYMVMEFLEGQDLNDQIGSSVPLSLEEKLRIMKDICNGVSYAHKQELIHRDIKPHNIFMTVTEQVKILDFGLARLVSAHSKSSKLIGSPHYMAPEVWNKNADKRSDIFALGAVFYEFVTCRKAFEGEGFEQVFFSILHNTPEPMETIDTALPPELSTIVLRALAKDPGERYQQVDEILEALGQLELSLEGRRQTLQTEAMESVGKLGLLIQENRELLDEGDLEVIRRIAPSLVDPREQEPTDESATVYQPPIDYLRLVEVCRDAADAHERISSLIQSRRKFAPDVTRALDFEKGGELKKALEIYERICREDPDHTQAIGRREELAEKIAAQHNQEVKAREIQQYMERAHEKFGAGDWPGCQELLQKALELDKGYEEAIGLLDQTRRQVEEDDKRSRREERQLREQESVQLRRVEALYQEATELFLGNDLAASRTLLDEAAGIEPEHRAVRTLREAVLAKIQQQEELTQKRQGSNEALDRAQATLEQKDFGAARAEVGKAREIWPESPRIVEVSAAVEKAEGEYREKQQRQEKMVLLLQEARSLNEEGQDTEAVRKLDEVLGLDPANVEARTLRQQVEERRQTRESARQMFELAQKMAAASDWSGSKTLLDQVLSLYPDHAEAKALLGSVDSAIQKQQELASRRLDCEQALARATEALTQGDLELAHREVARARESFPDSPRIPELIREIERVTENKRTEAERQTKVASIFEQARELHEAGDEDTAFVRLEELFDLDPGNSDARKLRRAIDSKRRARESTEEFYQKALVRFEADDLPACLAYLEEVFSRQPEHSEAKKLQETVQERIRELEERAARQRQSEDALARAQDGLRSEDLDRARQEVEKAHAAYPDSPRIAEVRDQLRQAEEEQQARKEREERVAGLREEAQSAYETGDEEAALTKIRALLELKPGDGTGLELRQRIEQRSQATAQAERLYRRAEQRFQSDDLSGCLALLEEVFSVQPDHVDAKRLREAVQARSKADAALDEKVVASNDALGRARRALSGQDFEQARQEVEIGRQLHPQAGWIAEMAAAIEKAAEQERRQRDQQQQLERLMAKALSLDEAGDEEIALVQLQELLTLEPADVDALKLRREIERRREARQKEEKERQERIESNYRRACEAEAASKMARAAKLARAVLAEDGGHAEAIELLERVEEEAGKRQKAEERKRDRIRRLRDSAQTAQMEHRYAEAVQALDEILRLEPDDVEVLQLREQGQRALEVQRDNAARHAEGQKERRSGLELLRDKRYPESLAALGRAAELLEGDRQVESAIREAEAARRVEVERAEIQAGIAGARKQMARGDLDSARSSILQVLELSPKNALAEELLGSVDRAQEQRSRQEKVAALLVQGRLAVSEQSYEDGSERIRQLLAIDPENEEAQGLLKTVEQALEERSKREKVAEVLVETQRAFNEQKFEEAAARILEVLLLDPQNEEAKGLRGTIDRAREEKSKQERIDDLLVQSQQALTKQLFEESALRAREVFALDAENDEARRLLDRVGQAQEKNRIDEEVAGLLAQCLEAKRGKNLDEAAHFARQAANLDPENMEAVGLRDQIENEIRALKKEQEKEKRRIARERSAALWSVRMKAVRRTVTVGVVLAVVGWSAFQVYGFYLDWRIRGGLETFSAAIDQGDYSEAAQAVDLLSQYHSPEEVAGLRAEMDSKFSTNFTDDFTQGLQKWDAPQGWSIDTNPNFTRLSVSGPGRGFVQGKYWHDSEVRFYLEFKTGRAASWIVRAHDQQNYYMFRITPARRAEGDKVFHRFDIFDCQEGRTELIDSKEIPDDLGKPGEQFYVTIRASGFQIAHSLQAASAPKPITLANVEDVAHPSGSFGFGTVEDEEFYVYDLQIAPLGAKKN